MPCGPLPWRYEDRSVMTPIGQLVPGVQASICGTIVRSEAKRARSRRLAILDIVVEDSTGRLQAVFFNQPFLEPLFTVGTSVMLTGRMVAGAQGWVAMRMEVAQYEVVGAESEAPLHVGRIVPVYHETKGWTSRQMRVLMKGLLDAHAVEAQEVLPVPLRARYRLLPIQQAIQDVHFPQPGTDGGQLDRGLTPAHRRLAFEELFVLQLALASRQRVMKEEVKQVSFNPKTPLLGKLDRALPFQLTAAQERVIREILSDMTSRKPMNRLVQGDVGSGKTIVAVQAMVLACGSGYQAALMAPTEILAEQHYRTMKRLLEPLGLSVVLVSGGGRAAARKAVRAQVASGAAQVVIGTHAVIQQGVTFAKLGLAVVDEQHRFGVLQRKTLIEKGYKPDVLVLTATPIPRTLAMTVYGDLDVSVIDQMPPGRKPVRTFLLSDSQRGRAYQILRDELRSGRQAYVVYPLVEESEKTDLQAAMQGAEQLQAEELAEFRVGLVHGRMKSEEKEQVMASYKKGDDPGPGLDDGGGGRGRCAQCHGHDDRACRAVRAGAVAPIARTGRAKRTPVLLSADGLGRGAVSIGEAQGGRRTAIGGPGTAGGARAIDRWVCDCRGRSPHSRARRVFWVPAVGHAGVSRRESGAGCRYTSAGAAGGLCTVETGPTAEGAGASGLARDDVAAVGSEVGFGIGQLR